MKKTNRFFAVFLIFTLLFVNSIIISFAEDDISKTHFIIYLKEEYCLRVQEVIASIDCDHIGEVSELTNPDDYDEPYTPMLLVWVKDKDKALFYKAQEYFFDKDYYLKTTYDVLVGNPEATLVRTHFLIIVKEEYAKDLTAITESIDSKYISHVKEAEYFLPSSDPCTALYVYMSNDDEAFFEPAQKYFSDKEYVDKIEYDYLGHICKNLFGDTDNDGKYTARDARFILRCSVNLEKYEHLHSCDANADGKVSAEDARIVLRWSVGLCD